MSDETQAPNITTTIHTLTQGSDVNAKTIIFSASEIAQLLALGVQFIALIDKIKNAQPDAWQAVATDFQAAHDAWEVSKASYHNDANELPLGTALSAPSGPVETPPGSVADTQS